MAWLLKCNFNILSLKTNFVLDFFDKEKTDIAIFLDSVHMIKLVLSIYEVKIIILT